MNNPQFRTEKVVGEIVKKNDYEIDMACITVICKDTTGKIVDIKNTYADAVPANGSLPFEGNRQPDPNVDSALKKR